MKIQKIGMRTVKTTFAVFITIVISQVLELRNPFFAGIAAIVAMQTSVSQSLAVGKDRMQGTILGAITALLFSLVAPENPLFIGIGTLIVIYICNLLELRESTQLSTIVFLSIILNYEEGSRIGYALYRTLDTLIGLVLGTLINYFILPPNTEASLTEDIEKLYSYSRDMIDGVLFRHRKTSLDRFKEDLIVMNEDYSLLQRDSQLNLHDNRNVSNLEKVLGLFEGIYYHMGILSSMDGPFNINLANRRALKELFPRDLSIEGTEDRGELDLICNYHLGQILDNMHSIRTSMDMVDDKRPSP